ncbi:MAG: hypothetical protein WBM09_13860 [Gallionella sp.]
MEFAGYLKVFILLFALAIPISIVFLVYRTLFSGLRSIPSSRNPGNTSADTAEAEHAHDQKRESPGKEAG